MDKQLKKELAGFIYAFEQTFGDDWDYGQTVLGVPEHRQARNFFDPDEFSNWGHHSALINHYRRLKKEMAAQNISIEDI